MNLWTHSFALAYLYYGCFIKPEICLYMQNYCIGTTLFNLIRFCGMSRLYRPFRYTAVHSARCTVYKNSAHQFALTCGSLSALYSPGNESVCNFKYPEWLYDNIISFKLRFNAFPKALIYASRCGISRKTAVKCYLLSPWDSPSFPNLLRIAT